jgi:hypothetical protein
MGIGRKDMAQDKLKDHWGNEVEQNVDGLPDDAPAKTGNTTPPSGQGGASPNTRPSYQDQFPPNPEPSASAAAKGEENDAVAKGETKKEKVAKK